ncbi:hypothetical protein Y032_0370g94 [Ancylostoma ceylanicum]|uniref:Uncharacterized protein n=1 Tax=Ancylostoma ceylanicum TaxID=53326 RepID=A0A016RUC7_9BILA|nr:hypothetical protein Y032_0370g94 [Ancylostoma ceylanicum]
MFYDGIHSDLVEYVRLWVSRCDMPGPFEVYLALMTLRTKPNVSARTETRGSSEISKLNCCSQCTRQ